MLLGGLKMLTSASQLHAEFEPIRYIMQSSVVHWALYPLTLHQLALKEIRISYYDL